MHSLSDLGIRFKILAAVLLMACVAAGGAIYANFGMMQIDRSYAALLAHDEVAVLQTSRFTRFVNSHGYAVYKLMESKNAVTATDGDDYAKVQARAKAEYEDLKAHAADTLAAAAKSLPELADDWDRKASAYQAIRKNTDRAMELVLSDDISDATIVMAETDGMIAALTKFNTTTIAALSERIQARSQALGTDTATTGHTTLGIMIGAALLVGSIAMVLAGRTITAPLGALRDAMRRLVAGDLEVAVPGRERLDEVGQMAAAVQVFKENAIAKLRIEGEATTAQRLTEDERGRSAKVLAEGAQQQSLVVQAIGSGLKRLSSGELVYRIEQRFPEEYEKLRADFNDAMAKLQETMKVVAANASIIGSGTSEISTASDDLSRRTEQQAASLEETAATLDEITATVRKTAASAKHAREVASSAKGNAEQSGHVVRQAVEAMSEIEKSSQQISQIIGVIDEIAFQTNLLALNAGVEAARAGDAGRGFAVVASEVRALAQRSAAAAKEIKTLILTSSDQVGHGVVFVGQTGEALDRIVAEVNQLNGIVSEISSSTEEQATALDEVNTAVNQMDQLTQQNAAMVEQSTAATQALAQQTGNLASLIGQFQVGDKITEPLQRGLKQTKPQICAASPPARALRIVG